LMPCLVWRRFQPHSINYLTWLHESWPHKQGVGRRWVLGGGLVEK
jgi:hypothetical protein